MNNRGSYRGVLDQPAAPARARENPGAPIWRPVPDSGAGTVPHPRRRDTSGFRQIPSSARPIAVPGAATQVVRGPQPVRVPEPVRTPQPVRRVVNPGGIALDGIEQLGEPVPARRGGRDVIHRYVGIDLGQSPEVAYENALREQIGTAVGAAYPIAVLNIKGGVGKEAVVEALGSTFASVRSDRVVAVDLDAGDLADRHGRRNNLSLADLLSATSVARYADVRAHTFMNSSGLEVLGLPDYAYSNWSISRQDFVKAFSILRNHYSLVLMDCPKTLNSGVMEAVLPESRA